MVDGSVSLPPPMGFPEDKRVRDARPFTRRRHVTCERWRYRGAEGLPSSPFLSYFRGKSRSSQRRQEGWTGDSSISCRCKDPLIEYVEARLFHKIATTSCLLLCQLIGKVVGIMLYENIRICGRARARVRVCVSVTRH